MLWTLPFWEHDGDDDDDNDDDDDDDDDSVPWPPYTHTYIYIYSYILYIYIFLMGLSRCYGLWPLPAAWHVFLTTTPRARYYLLHFP